MTPVLSTMLPALVIFVGAPLAIWWMRRSRATVPGSLRVVSRTALTRNGVVAVVETDGRRFLVGATDHGISMLSELEEAPQTATDVRSTELPPIDVITDEDRIPARPALLRRGPGTSPLDALREMTVRKPVRPKARREQPTI